MAKKKNPPPVKTDAELDALIKPQKKKAALGMSLTVFGCVLFIILAFTGSVLGIILGCLVFGIGLYIRTEAKKVIKAHMTEAALLPALRTVFDNVYYRPDRHIHESVIRGASMGFPIGKVTGSDHIRGIYKGVAVEMSDITVKTVSESTDDEGTTTETEDIQFKGLFLICGFPKNFTADLILRDRKGIFDKLTRNEIPADDPAFNRKFVIHADSELAVSYILTPSMMAHILDMRQKANGRIYMRFRRDGRLFLAVDTGKDAFEINKVGIANAERIRNQFISELRYVTDLIDALQLVKALHTKP